VTVHRLPTGVDRCRNRLLNALFGADRAHWLSQLKSVELRRDEVLAESDAQYLYFPTTAVVSILYTTQEGGSAEIAVIGHNGVVGLGMFTCRNAQPIQAKVQSAGHAYRLRGSVAKEEALRGGELLDILSRYAQTLHGQLAQAAVCNRHHSIDQQLCRRLLVGLDLSYSNELVMSHQAAARLIGVRRESVTLAAHRLLDAGIIRYRRGHIVVLDRARLEQRACECYQALQRQYDQLLPNCAVAATAAPGSFVCASSLLRPAVTRRRHVSNATAAAQDLRGVVREGDVAKREWDAAELT